MQIININQHMNSANSLVNKSQNNVSSTSQMKNHPSFGLKFSYDSADALFVAGTKMKLSNIMSIRRKQELLESIEIRFRKLPKEFELYWGSLSDKASGFKSYFKNFTNNSISKAVQDLADTNLSRFVEKELPNIKISGTDTAQKLEEPQFIRECFGEDMTFIKDKLRLINEFAKKPGNKATIYPVTNKYSNVHDDGSPRQIKGVYLRLTSKENGLITYDCCGRFERVELPKR